LWRCKGLVTSADLPVGNLRRSRWDDPSFLSFPIDVIQRAVWMHLRFTPSYRDVEDLLAERGVQVSYETVRRWVHVFGPSIARRLRVRRPKPHGRWHLDEMFVRIDGNQMYLWRAVDAEGEVLEVLVPKQNVGARSPTLHVSS
jgi:putative transposase